MKTTFSLGAAFLCLFLLSACASSPEYPGQSRANVASASAGKKKPAQQMPKAEETICIGQDCTCQAYDME